MTGAKRKGVVVGGIAKLGDLFVSLLSPQAFRHATLARDQVAGLPPKEAATALVLALVSLVSSEKLKRDDVLEILRVALTAVEQQPTTTSTTDPEPGTT